MTTIHQIACPIPFPLKTVNCYYISDSIPTLIDSGINSAECFTAVEGGVRLAGGSIQDIKRIIVTHAHTDHAGLAGKLADLSEADVYLHQWDYPKFISGHSDKNQEHFQRFHQFLCYAGLPDALALTLVQTFAQRVSQLVCPILDPQLLNGDEIFAFDDFQLRVVHSPGHTIGSICLYNEEFKELFSGDTLLERITPNPVVEVNLPSTQKNYISILRFRESLDTLSRLDAVHVRPGHGAAFDHANQRIAAVRDHFTSRNQNVLKKMTVGFDRTSSHRSLTLYQLTRNLFPRLKGLELFLGLSEVYAYLQVLQDASRLEQWQEKGVGRYRLIHTSGSLKKVNGNQIC